LHRNETKKTYPEEGENGDYLFSEINNLAFEEAMTSAIAKIVAGRKVPTENLSKAIPANDSIRIGNLNIPVELATDPIAGLSGRDSLVPGTGMFFDLDGHPVITMQGMKFPLDLVWMAGGRVVDLTENALVPVLDQETLYIPEAHATAVLEINGGEVQRLGIKIGDFVVGDNLLWKQSNLSKLLVLETALEHLFKMKPNELPEYGKAPPNTPTYKGKRGGVRQWDTLYNKSNKT